MKKIIAVAAILLALAAAYAAGRQSGLDQAKPREIFAGAEWRVCEAPEGLEDFVGEPIAPGTRLYAMDETEDYDGSVFVLVGDDKVDLPLCVWKSPASRQGENQKGGETREKIKNSRTADRARLTKP